MKKVKQDIADKDVSRVVLAEQATHTLREKTTLVERKYRALQGHYATLQREHDALTDYAKRPVTPIHIEPRKSKAHGEAVPLLILSDWHVEEEVKPATVGGKNSYNLEVAKRRAERIFQTAVKLVREKENDVRIHEIAVFLLGDFITGRIHEENIENALLLPVEALHYAQSLIEGGIDFLLSHTKKDLVFYCKVGNHSRITNRVHASTEQGNSLEFAMYWSLKRKYEGKRVRFHIEPSYLSVVNILGLPVRFHHGHAVNYGGGVGGLHIPLRKAIHAWNQNERAALDIMGHYHSFTENSTIKYIVNGSLIGYSAYAERVKATSEPPIQGFGIIHSKYGFTDITPIFAE